jgi:hypothetical protein
VHSSLPDRSHRHATPGDDFTGTQRPGRVLTEDSSLSSDAQRKLTGLGLGQRRQRERDRGNERIFIGQTEGKWTCQEQGELARGALGGAGPSARSPGIFYLFAKICSVRPSVPDSPSARWPRAKGSLPS